MDSDGQEALLPVVYCLSCGAELPPKSNYENRELCPFCGASVCESDPSIVSTLLDKQEEPGSGCPSSAPSNEPPKDEEAAVSTEDIVAAAVELVKRRQFQEAEASLRTIEDGWSNKSVAYGIALCRYRQGDLDEAAIFAARAKELNSTRAVALLQRIEDGRSIAANIPDLSPETPASSPALPETPEEPPTPVTDAAVEPTMSPSEPPSPPATPPPFVPPSEPPPPPTQPASNNDSIPWFQPGNFSVQRQDALATEQVLEIEDTFEWLMVGDSLDPEAVQALARREGDKATAVALHIEHGCVQIRPRWLTDDELKATVVRIGPYLLIGLLYIVLCAVYVPLHACALLVSFNPLLWVSIPLCLFLDAKDTVVALLTYAVILINFLKGSLALLGNQPFMYLPYGSRLTADGALFEVHQGEHVQVIRASFSMALLRERLNQKSVRESGVLGCVVAPFVALGSALSAIRRVITSHNEEYAPPVELFAFVVGSPIDLNAPTGLANRLRYWVREGIHKQERTVVLASIDGAKGPAIQRAIEDALGVEVAFVDDTVARKTFWSRSR